MISFLLNVLGYHLYFLGYGRYKFSQVDYFLYVSIYLYDDEARNTLSKLAIRVIAYTFQIVSCTKFSFFIFFIY